jgi:hypothetical protein
MKVTKADLQRFRSHVQVTEECWVWTARTDSKGYGEFKHGGKKHKAHRWLWEAKNGSILPEDISIDHLCRNRACVRPSHLEPVTIGENMRRGTIHR